MVMFPVSDAYTLQTFGDSSLLNSLTAELTGMPITQMDSTLYWSGLHLAISFVIRIVSHLYCSRYEAGWGGHLFFRCWVVNLRFGHNRAIKACSEQKPPLLPSIEGWMGRLSISPIQTRGSEELIYSWKKPRRITPAISSAYFASISALRNSF